MTSSIKAGDSRGIPTNAVELAMPLPFGGVSKDPTIQSTMAVNAYLVNRTMRSIKICCEDSYCLGKKHGRTFVQGVRLCVNIANINLPEVIKWPGSLQPVGGLAP
ncbi:uncharacterized protein ARMOST_11967 [Armillaria ostoyae]|uniref:Uncharacterized protein n=1 Tax=Armillaria ostoyae TaxID=47428 RepID=A0A284RIL3_ARMOS|nr:uncharacterized protein ARMOST_11967 [Armillaria ostoyae]